MQNCTQVAGAVKEQVITGAGKKGFFRRIAEKIGLAQREVAECRGKSLREMAEMTSKKDVVSITNNLDGIDTVIRSAGERYYELEQELKYDIRYKIKRYTEELQSGEIDTKINEMRAKVKDVEDRIRWEKPWEESNVTADGWGGIPAESAEHFKYRIDRMKEEDLYPLQEELSTLISRKNNLPKEIQSLKEKEKAVVEEMELMKTQVETYIEKYKQIAKSNNIDPYIHPDSYWETMYHYKDGKFGID